MRLVLILPRTQIGFFSTFIVHLKAFLDRNSENLVKLGGTLLAILWYNT